MSIYHCSIKIIPRGKGRSIVACAAYRSGEKLYNDETGLLHDFTKKSGVVMNEILLPQNAPKRYENREVLWNEVQQIEKRGDAQFAREIEVALPIEMSRDEQIECVRNYIKENFTVKGMIADWALHDKGDGNPHAHILLSIRGIGEDAKWMQKQKTVFANAYDDNGKPIYNPSLPSYDPKNREETSKYRIPQLDENGNQKTRIRQGKGTEYLWEKISIPANDWNDRANAEIWRRSWAECCNRYLSKENQIDHRSYKRQGIEREPFIHEGFIARKLEKRGKAAERCQQNREISKRNDLNYEIQNLAREFAFMVKEKMRGIYDRLNRIKFDFGKTQRAGAEDIAFGKASGGSGKFENGEFEIEGIARRIHEFKRAIHEAAREAELTDKAIRIAYGIERRQKNPKKRGDDLSK